MLFLPVGYRKFRPSVHRGFKVLLGGFVSFDFRGVFFVIGLLFFGGGIVFFDGFVLGEWVNAAPCGRVGFRCEGFVFLVYCLAFRRHDFAADVLCIKFVEQLALRKGRQKH